MGKIVKFCSSCDEGFAEKFGFCPNCGASLQSFEMNPVVPEAAAPVAEVAPIVAAPAVTEVMETVETPAEVVQEAAPAAETHEAIAEPVVEEPIIEEPVVEAVAPVKKAAAPKAAAAAASAFVQTKPVDVDRIPNSLEAAHEAYASEGGYFVTVIEEKNVTQRNALLAGACGFMLVTLLSAMVINIFSKDLEVGSISDDVFNAVIVDDIPTTVEEEQQKKDKDNGGGGGGGGRQEKDPASKGDPPNQSPDPIRPPDVHIPKLDNPDLVLPPATTKGKLDMSRYTQVGLLNGGDTPSNGGGSGRGIGNGNGNGAGNGIGDGNGNGIGSGSGNGNGNGNGNGTGDGDNGAPPPPKAVGVTQGIKIISKPRPGYTDAARQANIQGTVILRVMFLASGQIGSISAVKGLPNGLTEKAIEAAHSIRFEPAKTNGVGQTVSKQIEYSFSIY